MSDNRRFSRGGAYKCASCGKLTRETGSGEASLDLCLACYDDAGWENEHNDYHIHEGPEPACPYCKEKS